MKKRVSDNGFEHKYFERLRIARATISDSREKDVDAVRVNRKGWNYALYELGFYGNTPRNWGSLEEFKASGYNGLFNMRSKTGIGRDQVPYGLTLDQLDENVERFRSLGVTPNMISFNEVMPDDKLVIQGELDRTHLGLGLRYSFEKDRMNKALATKDHLDHGLTAQVILERYLGDYYFDKLKEVLDFFPSAAIEFSYWSVSVGVLDEPLVIWEVRNY